MAQQELENYVDGGEAREKVPAADIGSCTTNGKEDAL
jgi:hypothetical protein